MVAPPALCAFYARFSSASALMPLGAGTPSALPRRRVQLLGTLMVCPGTARGGEGEIERFELSGYANGNASKVELSPAAVYC